MHSVEEKVTRLIMEMVDVDPKEITREATLEGDLKMDDLDVVELVMKLEKLFGIQIPGDSDLFKTVGDVVGYIEKRLG